MIQEESKAMKDLATQQIDALRDALEMERSRREQADERISELTEVLVDFSSAELLTFNFRC
jgi:hypothetical protein